MMNLWHATIVSITSLKHPDETGSLTGDIMNLWDQTKVNSWDENWSCQKKNELIKDLRVDKALETSCFPSVSSTQTTSRHTWIVFFFLLVFICVHCNGGSTQTALRHTWAYSLNCFSWIIGFYLCAWNWPWAFSLHAPVLVTQFLLMSLLNWIGLLVFFPVCIAMNESFGFAHSQRCFHCMYWALLQNC